MMAEQQCDIAAVAAHLGDGPHRRRRHLGSLALPRPDIYRPAHSLQVRIDFHAHSIAFSLRIRSFAIHSEYLLTKSVVGPGVRTN